MSEIKRPNATLRTLLSLAWPVIVSRSTQVVIGVSDAVMVASLGASALAATTAGGLNTFAFMILPMGVTFIVASFSSQLFGKGDLAGARRYGHYGLTIAAVTQVVAMAGIPFIPWLLARFDYAADVRAQMASYMAIRLYSCGAAIGMEALSNYYGGVGNTRLPMAISLFAMAINVVGNYALIGGHLGAPAMGVNGAALSNTISTWIAFALFYSLFLRDGRGMPKPALAMRELLRMLRFGLPSGFNWFFEFYAYNIFVSVVVASLGTTAVAAMMAVQQINSVAFMPAFGLSSAGAILVGQAIGADAKDDVPRIVKTTFATAATWQSMVALACLLIPTLLLQPFVGGDGADDLLRTGKRMVMISAGWQIFDAIAGTISEALRAAGDTAFPLWARTIIAWVIFVPGSYLTVKHFGLGELGALGWFLAYFALLAVTMFLRFRTGAWRTMQLTEPDVVG